jgi:hypothetical protein
MDHSAQSKMPLNGVKKFCIENNINFTQHNIQISFNASFDFRFLLKQPGLGVAYLVLIMRSCRN